MNGNVVNVYQKGTSNKTPLTGEPPAAFKKFLIQISSKKFGESAQVDKISNYNYGKTCIGVSKSKIIIVIQQDGLKGASLATIRDYFHIHLLWTSAVNMLNKHFRSNLKLVFH